MPAGENGDSKSSLQSTPHISLVRRKRGGCCSDRRLGERWRGGRHTAVAVKAPEDNISGGGGSHSEVRQPPLVCDVSTAAKNSPGENHRGELQGWDEACWMRVRVQVAATVSECLEVGVTLEISVRSEMWLVMSELRLKITQVGSTDL